MSKTIALLISTNLFPFIQYIRCLEKFYFNHTFLNYSPYPLRILHEILWIFIIAVKLFHLFKIFPHRMIVNILKKLLQLINSDKMSFFRI